MEKGKGKEHASPITPLATNPSINSSTQVIPISFYPDFSSYMHGGHAPMPHALLPPFLPCPNANPSSWTCQSSAPPSLIGIPSASSSRVEEIQEPTPDSREVEIFSTSSESEDNNEAEIENIVHNEGADIIEEPKVGMVFKSQDELVAYYKGYGKQCGFGIMTQRSHRFEDGSLRYIMLCCSRGGKARNRMTNVARPRPTSKTDCKAKINVTFMDGVFKLLSVHNSHNHAVSPQKSRFFRCNREVSESVKRVLDTNDQAGIRLNKSFAALVQEAGGFENLPFSEKDCRNYIDKARHLRLGKGGAEALRQYFARMQHKNDGFFSDIDHDDDGRLKNVFWADARSRVAYKYWGDVVTFDTTYLTNRYCLWHILKKVPEKLGSHHAYKTGLKTSLMKCVYDSQTIEEFENSWNVLITTHNLQENAWLHSLYDEREFWVPIFLKEIFWAGMSTTQRSESMNAFFDGYVHSRTNLKEFVDQFDNALRKKIENENGADFHSFHVTIPVVSISPLEKICQNIYTNAKFREVQKEIIGMVGVLPS
ncbi:protein FAR1-RELATED SEQUENCE 5-like [Carya illinoinensis]|uniref:protein FAR1-RELATED SEQUENCE 5-like n=1 Tax=Carya illinoinensis TaxID=32201 RepID=UPI001C71DA2A|nr:protein FAR1-RELATED SEQUENCE 5-like [Carya illinoinensis]